MRGPRSAQGISGFSSSQELGEAGLEHAVSWVRAVHPRELAHWPGRPRYLRQARCQREISDDHVEVVDLPHIFVR